jgi:hypothetical protein
MLSKTRREVEMCKTTSEIGMLHTVFFSTTPYSHNNNKKNKTPTFAFVANWQSRVHVQVQYHHKDSAGDPWEHLEGWIGNPVKIKSKQHKLGL